MMKKMKKKMKPNNILKKVNLLNFKKDYLIKTLLKVKKKLMKKKTISKKQMKKI
jgi:hypothetical protein